MAFSKRTLDVAVRRSKSNSSAYPDLQCSYDLLGRLFEINEPLEQMLGYSRQEMLGANFREFLDPVSWELTRAAIWEQTGGAGSEPRKIQVRRKTGELHTLEMATRLVFDKGIPVAVHAIGRDLTPPARRARRKRQALWSDHLKELHRLSTTKYSSLTEVFADFLEAGCDIFGLKYGSVLAPDGDFAVVEATPGDSSFLCSKARVLSSRTHFRLFSDRICTRVFDYPVEEHGVDPDVQICIATPIFAGTDFYGMLTFSGKRNLARKFTHHDREIIELLSRAFGRFILEHRMLAERKSAVDLLQSRNGILERAGSRPLTDTLLEVGRMLENRCPESKCLFLLVEDGVLSSIAAPSLPAAFVHRLKGLELQLPTNPGLDQDRSLFSAADFEFAEPLGFAFSCARPILSGTGSLVGVLVLLAPNPGAFEPPDAEVVTMSVRMAGIAIEQQDLGDRLAYQAQHDSLTGLPNRFRFLEILDSHVEQAHTRQGIVAVLCLGLDRFKQINDTLGRKAGDQLLIEVAERLRSCLDGSSMAARMDGDEFAVVLSNPVSESEAIEASRRFLEALRSPYQIDGRELFVTASIGLSFFPKHGENSSALLRTADSAMYHAKNEGKNVIECFVTNGHQGGMERLDLENGLRRALEKSEFDLNFQPIVCIDGKLDGFEVLLGWNHANLGRISPVRFIPIAEETGLIVPIGQWVLEQACRHGASWIKAGLPLKSISVNVSALQFARPHFVEAVATVLESTGFPAKLLELELTEGLVLRDIADSIHRMTELQHIGVRTIIDDFGTGYSSLNYLRRLPVSGLKIDQSFLRDVDSPSSTLSVVEAIVSLAHNINLTVVAEGVETLHELELMRIAGCDRVQGHLYGVALKAAAAGRLLARPDCCVPVPRKMPVPSKPS